MNTAAHSTELSTLEREGAGHCRAPASTALAATVVEAGAWTAIGIGLLVLLGWYADIPLLLKLHSSFVAMQFNTALSLLAGGLGSLAAVRGNRKLARVGGAVMFTIAGLVLLEYLTGQTLGIDTLQWHLGVDRDAMYEHAVIRTSSPGRLAPNTALALLLSGTILLMIRSIGRNAIASLIGSVLGMAVICIGLTALLGYAGGAPSAYGWAQMTRMAVPTAFAITALGLSLSAFIATRFVSDADSFFVRLPWLVGTGGVIVSLGLGFAALDREHSRIDTEVRHMATRLERQTTELVNLRMQMLTRLAMRWYFSGHPAQDRWEYEASLNLGMDGFQAIGWIDAARQPRSIVPADDSMRTTLAAVAGLPAILTAMEKARTRRAPVIAAATAGTRDHTAIIGTQPLFHDGRFGGWLLGLVSATNTFDTVVRQALLGDYAVTVHDGQRPIYSHVPSHSSVESEYGRDVYVSAQGMTWRVRISPTTEALSVYRTSAPIVTPLVTLLLTALLVWLIALSLRARSREAEAAIDRERGREAAIALARAAELGEINDRLRQEIAERVQAEEQQRSLQEQLLQSQKMEAIGKLAGGVAHDFNNLLTVISGYSDILLSDTEPGDSRREDLCEIKQAAHRAAALTSQLLAFSRKQVMQPKVIDLGEIVNGLGSMLRRLIGADIELVTCRAPDVGLIKADPGQIEQVIVNLAVNARDAMPLGGRLMIEVSNADLSDDIGDRHIGALPGSFVALTVSDTGTGMSRETIEKIFEPFFTTKEAGKGTGLGLSTVHGIVKQSGGDLWVYSEVGKGTAFKLYFPRLETVEEAYHAPDVEVESTRGSETVLLVEDDEALRELTRKLLTSSGYEVLVARNGLEALAICESHVGRVDLVVTDMVMPGLSGRALITHLQEVCSGFTVLYMSGYTDDDTFRRGEVEAGVPFIQKPFTPPSFLQKVRMVLDEASTPVGAPT